MIIKISAVIITLNEERNIGRCLDSLVNVVDEIIVVDSFSTDKTESICEEYKKVKFVKTKWKGYSETKNHGNNIAQNDWVISLDADEALSEELAENILNLRLKEGEAYEFNRLTNFCGKWVKHSGWFPDVKVRLMNKLNASWEGVVHESLSYTKPVSTKLIGGYLHHYSYYEISEHLERLKKYAHLSAIEKHKTGVKTNSLKIAFSPIFKFISVFFFKLGFLDGKTGYIIAKNEAKYNYWKYVKLNQLTNN